MRAIGIAVLPFSVVVFFIAGLLGRPAGFVAAAVAAAVWVALVVIEGRSHYSELTADLIARHEGDPDD